ncbi:hypothetical protein [Micromonospora globbae]
MAYNATDAFCSANARFAGRCRIVESFISWLGMPAINSSALA